MILQQGEITRLDGRPWAAVELLSDLRLEEVVLHIGRWAKAALAGRPFQLFFPIQARTLAGVQMLTPYLLVRSEDLNDLRDLQGLYGVWGLKTDTPSGLDNKHRHAQVTEIPDAFVQEVKRKALEEAKKWSEGIRLHSFVRILVGNERMLCGKVTGLKNGTALVEVEMRSRKLEVEIPRCCLENLDELPKKQRSYFYVPGLDTEAK